MQGRLIQAFLAQVRRLNTQATSYDAALREVRRAADPVLPTGASGRVERDAAYVPVQVAPDDLEALHLVAGGNDPTRELTLTTHYRHLRALGLTTADGRSLLVVGARIEAILSVRTRATVLTFPDPPGLYVTKAEPRGWGLNMAAPTLNLLDLRCAARARAEATS